MERQRINFEIRPENGVFCIYMTARDASGKVTHETMCGHYTTRDLAERALEMTRGSLDKVNKPYEPKTFRRYTLHIPKEREVQNIALGLDPARMVEFAQEIILMNMTIHMLTDCFDRLDSLFGAYVSQGVKTHYKNAEKQINKLLDALYGSLFYNTDGANEYTAVVSDSLAWKETLRLMAMHCKRSDEDWRWVELKKALVRIFPTEACDNEDMRIYKSLREGIVGNKITDIE